MLKYLVDTNIFLEILLDQENKETCKHFLSVQLGNISITDFSLHSLGVILFKYNKENLFLKFLNDIIYKISVLSLPIDKYKDLVTNKKNFKLDFDDAYLYTLAKHYGLMIATQDKDFRKTKDVSYIFIEKTIL